MYANIPDEIKTYPQWIVWKYGEHQSGRPTKLPCRASDGQLADVTSPSDWSTFEQCVNAVLTGQFNGIGFCFADSDPFAGIDLDAPKDEHRNKDHDQAIVNDQRQLYESMASYTERSPSGTGVHIIVKARLNGPGKRRNCVELYDRARFFTFTGDVYQTARPIEHRQHLVETLHSEMMERSGGVKVNNTWTDAPATKTDQQVWDTAKDAANGDKFVALWQGQWEQLTDSNTGKPYISHSEADQALMNILAFYTQNRDQLRSLYKASVLGNDPKDKFKHRWQRTDFVDRAINLALDRVPPAVDMAGVHEARERYLAMQLFKQPPPEPAAVVQLADGNPYKFPPGLLGELATFFFQSAPKGVPEIALATAIAYLAGLTGTAYNTRGMGLNVYLLVLAKTGRGKGAVSNGINKLDHYMREANKHMQTRVSPRCADYLASSQALLKEIGERQSMTWVVGEMGLMLSLSDQKASEQDKRLKGTILDLYGRSGFTSTAGKMRYSDSDKNVKEASSPALTIIGETVAETLFSALDAQAVGGGLLPRFSIIDYQGVRPPTNWDAHTVAPSEDLLNKLSSLVMRHLVMTTEGTRNFINVAWDDDAEKLLREFSAFIDGKINASTGEGNKRIVDEIWNRGDVKAMKLAALFAVGLNLDFPVITPAAFHWAVDMVVYECELFTKRYEAGELGSALNEFKPADEMEQAKAVAKALLHHLITPHEHQKGYHSQSKIEWHRNNTFCSSLLKLLLRNGLFKKDMSKAIDRALSLLIEMGAIQEWNQNDNSFTLTGITKTHRRPLYVVLDHTILARIAEH